MKNKLKKFLIFGAIAVCLAVGLTLVLVFGIKDKGLTVKLDTLTTSFDSNGEAKATLNDNDKTLTLENMDYGDSLSFYIRMSNITENNYNYRIRLTTETGEGETANSQFASNVVFEMFEEDINSITIYGNTEKVILQRSIKAETTSSIIRVKVSFPEIEGFDIDSFEDRTCTFKINVDSSLEDDGVDYDKDYSVVTDATSLSHALAKDEAIILLSNTESYTFPETIEVSKSLKIYGEHGTTSTIQGSFLVGPNGSLEIENAVINGHIQTVAEFPEEETQTQALKATALDSEKAAISQSVITLNNVTINGGEERINSTGIVNTTNIVSNDTKPAIMIETNTLLNILGTVKALGNWDAAGIGVGDEATVEITGDNLTAIGNGGYEVIPDNYCSDTVASLSAIDDEEFLSHLANEFTQDSHPDAFVQDTYKTWNKYSLGGNGGGSGIGAIYKNDLVGKIYIHDMKSLTAEGYGYHAFGIGGSTSEELTIENTYIKSVRGGWALNIATSSDDKGKSAPEGGAAIGVNKISESDSPKVSLTNVKIDEAFGGSKSAAIGARYWSNVEINITNCELNNIYGGITAAGIGGSRISNEVGNQDIIINIVSSNVEVAGGYLGAGIGAGYCTYVRRPDRVSSKGYKAAPMTTINIFGLLADGTKSIIKATGGYAAAGIGTGYHSPNVTGLITADVNTSQVQAGSEYTGKGYSTPEAIGLGVLNASEDGSLVIDNLATYDENGYLISKSAEEIQSLINTYNTNNNLSEGDEGYIVYEEGKNYHVTSGIVDNSDKTPIE